MTPTAVAAAETLIRQRISSAESEYEALLDRLAAGVDELPERVIEVSEAAGKTLEDLRSDQGRLDARAAAKAEAELLPAAEKRLAEVEVELQAVSTELAAAHAMLTSRSNRLMQERNHLGARIAHLAEQNRRLTCGVFDSESQKRRQAEITKELRGLNEQRLAIEADVKQYRDAFARHEQAIKNHNPRQHDPGALATSKSMLAQAQQLLSIHQQRLADVQRQIARTHDAQAQLTAERLK